LLHHHRKPLGWWGRTCPWWSHAGCLESPPWPPCALAYLLGGSNACVFYRVSSSVKGRERLSHALIGCTVGFFIIPLVWLYTFTMSVYTITLIRIGYRHKSHTVHTPHIPL